VLAPDLRDERRKAKIKSSGASPALQEHRGGTPLPQEQGARLASS
jgi:hypothetical protein